MEKLKKSNGFTLVELIVVIAILAILTSVSVGGFEYSQKRAAIQNDKALVNQLNRVLDSYGIFTHNEGAIHDALIEEFGNEIEIQSLKFGYDIYYVEDMYEFELRVQAGNETKKNLHYYLNYESKNSFYINTTYNKISEDGTSSKINYLNDNQDFEYELEIGIDLTFDKNNLTFISKNHEVILDDIVVKSSNKIELEYSITKISEVIYENTDFAQPTINDDKITFYYPGNYEISITDGAGHETIKVSVYNISPSYQELSKIENTNSLFKQPQVVEIDESTYNFYMPFLSYIEIIDYYYLFEMYTYNDVNQSISNYLSESQQKEMIESGRILVKINDELVDLQFNNYDWYAMIPNLIHNENIITITYIYQGFNGKWSEPLTQTLLINKDTRSVTIQE